MLFRTFAELGLPPSLITLRLLLTNTRNRVYVNAHFSPHRYFRAGVRQGYPASPVIYLFVGHLLFRHLHSHQIGIPLRCNIGLPELPAELAQSAASGTTSDTDLSLRPSIREPKIRLGPLQYADDTNSVVTPTQVATFLEAMSKFAAATGQRLNLDKTHLLLVGAIPEQLPTRVEGLRVVSQATILGLTFHQGTHAPPADWDKLMDRLKSIHTKLLESRLPLFGKYRAWSTFGLSKLLYHAEFIPMPTPVAEEVSRLSRAFLGGGRNSWKLSVLSAHPRQEGLGCLPLDHHLHDRRSKWLIKLITAGTSKLWSKLAWNLVIKHPEVLRRSPSLPILQVGLRDKLTFPKFDTGPDDLELLLWGMKHLLPPYWLKGLHSIGWTVGAHDVSFWNYSVRHGTRILTRSDQTVRQTRYDTWLDLLDPELPKTDLERTLTHLWRAKINNCWKLPFWEVIENAQLTAERMRLTSPCGCASSGPSPGRYHHFVECPPARAIYDTLGSVEPPLGDRSQLDSRPTVRVPPKHLVHHLLNRSLRY